MPLRRARGRSGPPAVARSLAPALSLSLAPALSLSLSLALSACDAPPKPTTTSTAAAVSASASAFPLALASSVPPDPALLTASRRALSAATALAKKCKLGGYGGAITEYCDWRAPDVADVRDSASALRGLSSVPRSGAGASFVEEIRLFAEWAELVREIQKNGTLQHYQGLAIAWNAWRPDEKVAIDPVPLPNDGRDGDGGRDGGILVWERCDQGPCVVTGVIEPIGRRR